MNPTDIDKWEAQAIRGLLQKIMILGVLGCVCIIVFEYFFPHGLDYFTTLGCLTVGLLGFYFSRSGNVKIIVHALTISFLILLLTMEWGLRDRHYLMFKLFPLGVIFIYIVLTNNKLILVYILLFTLVECICLYLVVSQQPAADHMVLAWECINVIGYNFALSFMCHFFINHIAVHQQRNNEINLQNENLQVELSQEQARAYQNLLIGQEKERQRLSQDIHDGLSIRLSQLKAKLKPALFENDLTLDVVDDFEAIQEDLRNISHALSPTILKDFGLEKAINDLLFQIEVNDSDIDLTFEYSSEVSLNEEKERHLYYIIQELLNNAIKHSGAEQIKISIDTDSKEIRLIVTDNGGGYDPNLTKRKGIGLSNIRTRTSILGGSFEIILSPEGAKHVVIF